MRRWFGFASLAVGSAAAFALSLVTEPPRPAHAEESSAPEVAQCTIKGTTFLPTDLQIFDRPGDAVPIARFAGAATALQLSEVPYDFSKRRARVVTSDGSGRGNFRIEGYVDASKVPVITTTTVESVPGHVWIGEKREVRLHGASKDKLRIDKKLTAPFSQTFTGWAPCSALTLTDSPPPGWSVPGEARGYVVKTDALDLFDDSSDSALVTTLYRASSDIDVLLWSERRHGSYVHVTYHGEVVLEGWVRAKDVKPLPRGETMDQQAPPQRTRSGAKLALATQPREVKAPKDLSIRREASDSGAIIGVVEADTELYVLDVMVGWAAVLPKSLTVAPVGDGQFWVSAKELGIAVGK